MKKLITLFAIAAIAGLFTVGCQPSADAGATDKPAETTKPEGTDTSATGADTKTNEGTAEATTPAGDAGAAATPPADAAAGAAGTTAPSTEGGH